MRVRFYVDVITPYYIIQGEYPHLYAVTYPYKGKLQDGVRRFYFDVDFPEETFAEGTQTQSSAAFEIQPE